jgi:hypothetical protein
LIDVEDAVAVGDVAGDDALVAAERLVEVLLELPRAVRALHLPVAELLTNGRSAP